jgi:8-hydroxy-5-deazaflavin:NADPH oxidoreductase
MRYIFEKNCNMKIAIIGAGNVGGALALRWKNAGHEVVVGARDPQSPKMQKLEGGFPILGIGVAVQLSEAVLIATPPAAIFDLIAAMGEVSGKTLIDASNAIRQRPEPYPTVYHALKDRTRGEVVKCFNSTGFENMLNPVYDGEGIDMFMAGDSEKAKAVASQLALDAGFGACWDFGKADRVELLEQFALSWINLAIMQGHGRDIAFRLIRRK